MRFVPYLIVAAVMGGLLYPLIGRLAWGNTFQDSAGTWLDQLGFVDFAGGTVVHALGATAALVAILMIGPRADRFDADGRPRAIASGNSIMSLQGALILCFGWIGFNAGSLSISDPLAAEVIVNTLSTAAFGAVGGAIVGVILDKGIFNPSRTINGLIGGLVTSTASIHVMQANEAMLIGLLGGSLATWAAQYLLERWKLDDPVDVVATHGIAGIFGALLFALVAPVEMLVGQSRVMQFGIQLLGCAVVVALAAGVIFVTLKLVERFTPLRVTAEEELIGLNASEHGDSVGADRLNRALYEKVSADEQFGGAINLAEGDEHNDTVSMINQLIQRQEEARAAIAASEQKFQQFANTASDWLWETDRHLKFTVLHIVTEELEPLNNAQWQGKLLHEVVDIDVSRVSEIRQRCSEYKAFGPIEGEIQFSEVDSMHVEIRGTPHVDSRGQFAGYRGAISDISPRKIAEKRALHLSTHDELTNVRNRRALNADLSQMLIKACKSLKKVAYVGIDLDGFKAVNDSYGHDAGDNLLIAVARRLESVAAENCHVYRTGGDEFVMVIENLPIEGYDVDVNRIMQKALDRLCDEFPLQEKSVKISASIGIAVFPDDGYKSDELARRADLAMYSAKYQGKARVVWFDRQLDNEMDHRYRLESEVKRAMENDEFYFLYQPLIDTQSEKLEAFEALIRWKHPEKGELAPGEFLGIIEKHNLMPLLGDHILDKVCEFASTWGGRVDESAPRVAINISPSHLASEHFSDAVLDALKRHALPGNQLELELTEEAIIADHGKAMSVIDELRGSGVAFSIDDFGTGQTSLRYLSNFPVRTMKIDRSFVSSMGESDRAAEIMKSMIDMGAKLGYSVVAEGVENLQQLEMLKAWKCPVVQGFLFSKPVVQNDVLDMLADEAEDVSALKNAG
jgi:Amt family ammonium transporter